MKFPWQKDKEAPKNAVKMRAAVVPKSYKFTMGTMVTENNFTVNSYSTHFVALQPLKPGETAESIAKFAPGTINFGGSMISDEDAARDNVQRIQFDAPNWVGVIVCSDGAVYYDHVEMPVWADPTTQKIYSVDVEEMLREFEPKRQRASEIWGETDGPFALYFQIKSLPKDLVETGKMFASLPKTWLGAIKDLREDKAADPVPVHMWPDLTKYPPIDGMDYKAWTLVSANPALLAELGFSSETWQSASKGWNARMMKDWKIGALHGSDIDRIRKGATPSWEQ
jgi:hypothetical protein